MTALAALVLLFGVPAALFALMAAVADAIEGSRLDPWREARDREERTSEPVYWRPR